MNNFKDHPRISCGSRGNTDFDKMARSLRSKRRQKNNRVRRKKFGERETLKAWDHYNTICARKTSETNNDVETTPPSNQEAPMETGTVSKKDVAKWALSRNQKNKLAKLKKAKRKGKKKVTQKRH